MGFGSYDESEQDDENLDVDEEEGVELNKKEEKENDVKTENEDVENMMQHLDKNEEE